MVNRSSNLQVVFSDPGSQERFVIATQKLKQNDVYCLNKHPPPAPIPTPASPVPVSFLFFIMQWTAPGCTSITVDGSVHVGHRCWFVGKPCVGRAPKGQGGSWGGTTMGPERPKIFPENGIQHPHGQRLQGTTCSGLLTIRKWTAVGRLGPGFGPWVARFRRDGSLPP